MAKARFLWGRLFLSSPAYLEHEEKVLRYIIHRIDRDANLREVLQEPSYTPAGSIWSRRSARESWIPGSVTRPVGRSGRAEVLLPHPLRPLRRADRRAMSPRGCPWWK
jgi:hypothetical protein